MDFMFYNLCKLGLFVGSMGVGEWFLLTVGAHFMRERGRGRGRGRVGRESMQGESFDLTSSSVR